MADIETRIRESLRVVRVAIRAVETDTEGFREVIERVEREFEGPLGIPADTLDVILRKIERLLANALKRLEA